MNKFSEAQIQILRDQFATVKLVDPDGPAFKRLRAFVEGLDAEKKAQLVDAKIPWISYLASV